MGPVPGKMVAPFRNGKSKLICNELLARGNVRFHIIGPRRRVPAAAAVEAPAREVGRGRGVVP